VSAPATYIGLVDYLGDMLIKTLTIGTLILSIWALVDAAIRPTPAYTAAGKLTKPAWLAITALAVLFGLFFPLISIFRLAGLVGSIVYLVDVRPAVRETRGGPRW
jgi:Protein of unknown function (DUF2516)